IRIDWPGRPPGGPGPRHPRNTGTLSVLAGTDQGDRQVDASLPNGLAWNGRWVDPLGLPRPGQALLPIARVVRYGLKMVQGAGLARRVAKLPGQRQGAADVPGCFPDVTAVGQQS